MGLLSILSLSLSSSLSLYLFLCVFVTVIVIADVIFFPMMHNVLGLTWFCDDLKAPDWKCWSDDVQNDRRTEFQLADSTPLVGGGEWKLFGPQFRQTTYIRWKSYSLIFIISVDPMIFGKINLGLTQGRLFCPSHLSLQFLVEGKQITFTKFLTTISPKGRVAIFFLHITGKTVQCA